MSLTRPDQASSIEYPERDGKPMAETDMHIQLMINLRLALMEYFRDEADVYVGSNLLLYYVEGDSKKCVAPDVFVARGVGKGDRCIYKLWEEGRPPDIVFELSSRQTWREDLQTKWRLYEQLGVKEYFIFDPEYDYLDEALIGYKLEGGQYQPVEIKEGRVLSETLGLELVDTGDTLRLFDTKTERFLPTPAEEAEARRQAEAELARLREELERLRQTASPDDQPQ